MISDELVLTNDRTRISDAELARSKGALRSCWDLVESSSSSTTGQLLLLILLPTKCPE